jgi:hypothetical protein
MTLLAKANAARAKAEAAWRDLIGHPVAGRRAANTQFVTLIFFICPWEAHRQVFPFLF